MANPCETLTQAINQARSTSEADSIHAAAGAFPENVLATNAADSGLTIVGAGSSYRALVSALDTKDSRTPARSLKFKIVR